jgi:AraC-like DNA-binding protein
MPAGVVHTGRLTAKVEFYDAFFDPDRTPIAFPVPTMITMTPVLASLLTHLERTDLDPAARARAEAVVFDLLEPAPRQLALRLPGRSREHARIGPITETLLRDPGDPRSLDDWARELGLSERTVTRAFRQATGMSFARWRQTLRIHDAVHLLSEGTEVKAVAALVGYAQTSTFIAAFRREMGITPGSLGSAPGRVLTGLGADDVRNPASAVPIP